MARVKTTAIVADIKGKLNGSVFQGNNGILSLRQYAKPCNSFFQNRQSQRNFINKLQSAWRDLSTDQRLAWNNYAKQLQRSTVSQSNIFLNGQAVFIHINNNFNLLGEGLFLEPQGLKQEYVTSDFEIYNDNDSLLLVGEDSLLSVTNGWKMFLSYPVNASMNYKKNVVKFIPFFPDAQVEYDITTAYLSAFGVLPKVGDTIFMHMTPIDFESGLQGFTVVKKIEIKPKSTIYDILKNDLLVCWSLQKRFSEYTGPCIRLKNSQSPFNEVDIYFDTNGFCDWSAYDALTNKQNYYPIKIYDQVGNNDINVRMQVASGMISGQRLYFQPNYGGLFNELELSTTNGFSIIWNAPANQNEETYLFGFSAVYSGFVEYQNALYFAFDVGNMYFNIDSFPSDTCKFLGIVGEKNGDVKFYDNGGFYNNYAVGLSGSGKLDRIGDYDYGFSNDEVPFSEVLIFNKNLTEEEVNKIRALKID